MSYMRGRVLKRIDHLDPTSYVYDLLLLCAYKYIGPAPWVINMVINDHGDRWTFCPRRQRPGSGAGQRGAGTNSDPPLPQWCSAVLVGARDSPPQGMQRGSNPPPHPRAKRSATSPGHVRRCPPSTTSPAPPPSSAPDDLPLPARQPAEGSAAHVCEQTNPISDGHSAQKYSYACSVDEQVDMRTEPSG